MSDNKAERQHLEKIILNEVLNCVAQKDPDAEKCTMYIMGILDRLSELQPEPKPVNKTHDTLNVWHLFKNETPIFDKELLFKRYDGFVYLGKYWNGLFGNAFVANAITVEAVTEWIYVDEIASLLPSRETDKVLLELIKSWRKDQQELFDFSKKNGLSNALYDEGGLDMLDKIIRNAATKG